jgi:alpha-galactosidase
VLQILDKQVGLEEFAGPGHWNDPDMLEIGNGGQSISEYRAHFSLWCMLAAPLMSGNDLRDMNDSIRSLLTNKEVIAVNQDSLGMQAFKFVDYGDLEIWVKALSDDEASFCFLNRSNTPVNLKFNWRQFGVYHFSFRNSGFNTWKNTYEIRDLWKHKNIGTTADKLSARIGGHDVLMVRLAANNK